MKKIVAVLSFAFLVPNSFADANTRYTEFKMEYKSKAHAFKENISSKIDSQNDALLNPTSSISDRYTQFKVKMNAVKHSKN